MKFCNYVDKKSLIDRISVKINRKFGNAKYGKRWPEKSPEWYKQIHDDNWLIHDDFKKYLKSKNDRFSYFDYGIFSSFSGTRNYNPAAPIAFFGGLSYLFDAFPE